MQGQSTAPKSSPKFLPKGSKVTPSDLASKDATLVSSFHRRGFKGVVLMDRADPSKPYNIKPSKAWLAEGCIVRKGQKGARGLFHITQADLIAQPKAAPKKAKAQQGKLALTS
jgi:hypothetical protein